MNNFHQVVNDFIDVLLRDAAIRIGLGLMKAEPTAWGKLLDPTDRKFRDNLKRAVYVINYLLDHKKLEAPF